MKIAKHGGQFAKASANERHAQQFHGLAFVHLAGNSQRSQAAEGLFADGDQRRLHRLHLLPHGAHGGIDKAQQAVGEGGVALHHLRQLVQVHGFVLEHAQDFHVLEPVGWDLVVLHQRGPAEVVSLHERKAFIARLLVLLLRFDVFGDERNGRAVQPTQQLAPILLIGSSKIHLDVVGNLDQRLNAGLSREIIERQPEPARLQVPACADQFR